MSVKKFKLNQLRYLAICVFGFGSAFAVPAIAEDDTSGDTLQLEEVIVTGVTSGVSKLSSSLSVTTIGGDQADEFVPRHTTEIFKFIPGIRSESSAGESNTNISIRGVPIASGGGKFLQLHEDGLPYLEYGDIIVANADNYVSFDRSVARIEALKGGSAATLASNSPAGIINFISKRGEVAGGSVGLNLGLAGYGHQRFDFDYGQPLGTEENWLFHVGGFYRAGSGVRSVDYLANDGGQIKLSLQRNFEDGHVRLYVRQLNDTTPTYLPMPALASGSDSIANYSVLTSANTPLELLSNTTGDLRGGGRASSVGDGSSVSSSVIGGEIKFAVSKTVELDYRFRVAKNSGKFFGAFTAGLDSASNFAADPTGSSLTGIYNNDDSPSAVGLAYASGANSGEVLTNAQLQNLNGNGLIQNIRSFDNDINSLDNFSHNFAINFNLNEVNTIQLGIYTSVQEIDVNWYWQTYLADVQEQPRLFDVYGADGTTVLSDGGVVAFTAPDWGNCCYRETELKATTTAIYFAYSGTYADRHTLDISFRSDAGLTEGYYAFAGAIDENQTTPVVSQSEITSSRFDFDWGYGSFAIGYNVLITNSFSLYTNYSQGARVNADRLGDGGYYTNGTAVTDSVVNSITNIELGAKLDTEYFDLIGAFFVVNTEDANSEGTNDSGEVARLREYGSLGLDLEMSVDAGIYGLRANITWTDAEITAAPNNPAVVGNTPRRQADFVYTLLNTFKWGRSGLLSKSSIGLSIVGSTDSYAQDANNYQLPGYTYMNLFIRYYPTEDFSITLAANNFTNAVGYTEAEENEPVTINGVEYVRARSIAGATYSFSLNYEF